MMPTHLGLIPDGNRRWARERGLETLDGHRRGAEVMRDCLHWCYDAGIEEVSVYTLSMENLIGRPPSELKSLFTLFDEYLKKLSEDEFIHQHQIQVRFPGDTKKLPSKLTKLMNELTSTTIHHSKRFLNFLVAYGGRDEIVRCVQAIRRSKLTKITKQTLQRSLGVQRPVDMVIRTGGERRLSNFMLYQCAYAELYFLDKYWPDFTKEDLLTCLEKYQKTDRRIGA
jgi:undecaprenyl diphosphate synthase